MKKVMKQPKVGTIILALIVIVGIIMVITMGFNYDLQSQTAKKVELYLEKEFEISDIKKITDEVFEKQPVVIQKVEVFEDMVRITAKDITEEQKSNLISKINEKYGTELNSEEIKIDIMPHMKGRDIIKPYITYSIPIIVANIVILVYMAIRYREFGITKIVLKIIGTIILVQIVLFSLFAITRFPMGIMTMPVVILVYLLTLVGITTKLENKLAKNHEEN